mmetsp:Transcript_1054/g.3054  ORF Transcript_1054/g.3054 Transcript_1054/m.3054 type:complete len:451 (+) Transcript_1054:47-1399(+)
MPGPPTGERVVGAAVSVAQRITLAWIYFAYVCCYLLRKNYPLLLPTLDKTGVLSYAEAATVASVFETVVGIVKFFCGVYVDGHADPAGLLASCLLTAGGSCLVMTAVFVYPPDSSLVRVGLVSALWSLNGAGQAVAWPALARVFMSWFPDKTTRGSWYSVLATNQNVGGTMAPRIFPPLMRAYGWLSALYMPAVLTLGYAGVMKLSLASSPADAVHDAAAVAKKKAAAKEAPGLVETFQYLLTNPSFMLLSFAYIPVMVIRIALANWTAAIFEAGGMTLLEGGLALSALEVGGFAGSMVGGRLSDTLFNGRRGPVMCVFSFVCTPLALAYASVMEADEASLPMSKIVLLQILFFAIGAASFPPHSLIGLFSREIVPENMRSTAGCVAKATGQLGAAAAGLPLQQLASVYGWGCVGYVMAVCGVVAGLIFAPLWTRKPEVLETPRLAPKQE